MNSFETTRSLPIAVQTVAASLAAASFRILLVPVDTVKTIMQVEGKGGMATLMGKVRASGPSAFFHGALATSAATFAGHYPWFAVYNTLQEWVPKQSDPLAKLGRNAGIGFCATLCSDTISNSLRVVKTYRQTAATTISYAQCVKDIIAKDGIAGLMFRGLRTRILANGLQVRLRSSQQAATCVCMPSRCWVDCLCFTMGYGCRLLPTCAGGALFGCLLPLLYLHNRISQQPARTSRRLATAGRWAPGALV